MKNKVKRRKVIIGAVFIAAVCAAVAVIVAVTIGKDKAKAGQKQQRQTMIPLSRMDLTKSVSATGQIQSSSLKTVSAGVNGITIKRVKASVGENVKKGDVLVTFDESDLQEALSDARQNLSDTQSEADRNLSRAREELSEANDTYGKEKSELKRQVARAKKDLSETKKEISRLRKQIETPGENEQRAKLQEKLEKAEEAQNQAKSVYDAAVSNQKNTNRQNEKNIQTAEDGVQTAQSSRKKSVNEAEKQVKEAKEALEKCVVTAPIAGVVTARNAEEGETYDGGSMFQIADTSAYIISTSVDEYDVSSVKQGQRVVILTDATGEEELEGEVSFVAPSAGSTVLFSGNGTSSGTDGDGQTTSDGYEVEIALKSADGRLKFGMTARCSIILEEAENVFAVPYDAVHENPDGTAFISVSEGKGGAAPAEEVAVTRGMESDYYVEISGDGLNEGLFVLLPTDEASVDSDENSDEEKSSGQEFSGMFRGGTPGGMPEGSAPEAGRQMGGGRRSD